MTDSSADDSYLKRLPAEYYLGEAFVHWSLTIEDRKSGWLKPVSLYRFRELLTHTMFRYRLCCPVFVLMPDHLHMLWMGLHENSDQLNAGKHFRIRLNQMLEVLGFRLQQQGYDNVLKDEERLEESFEEVCDYIARNPERAALIASDKFQDYKYLGCLVPGYPEFKPFRNDFWLRFWRTSAYLRKSGLHQ